MTTQKERTYLGCADVVFTQGDAQRDYSKTKQYLAGYSDADLEREYHQANKDSLNAIHGRNAAIFGDLVAQELLSRGIIELPSIFSPIKVTRFQSWW